ncbi:MAG TPA: hypothetical protein VKF62_09670 [Planctomycetota bacterium]|nr:hypothetical protein [Planctomycetota bacterium]
MAEELAELRNLLRRVEEGAVRVPLPSGWYSREGDCVFFFNEDVPYRAERVDDLLTLYRALGSDRIVGAEVKGIRNLPKHHRLVLEVFRTGYVEMVALLLLTFQRQAEEHPGETAVREPRYGEAVGVLRGTVPIPRDAFLSA